MTKKSRLAVAGALVLGTSCAGDGLGQRAQDVVAPTLETFITDAPGVARFKGFNEVYDTTLDSCLKKCSEDARSNINSDESELQVSFVSTAADIASNRTFSLDANVEMALHAGNVDVNAGVKIASKSNFSRKAVRMLLVAHRWFKASHDEAVEIDSEKVDPELLLHSKATSDANFDDRLRKFMGRCGHVYAKQTIHGAYLFALYEFSSTDESKLSGLEAKLGVAFKSHVGKIGAGVNASYESELNEALSSVQWSVNVIAKGFKVNGREGEKEGKVALEQNGKTGLDLQRIIGFFDAMQDSVGDDMKAMQRGDDTHPISVFPLGLDVGYYPLLLKNVDSQDQIDARARMSQIQKAHDKMLQAYGQLAAGLIAGRDEVKRFLALPEGEQAKQQVMKWSGTPHDPAQRLRFNGKGLLDRVEPYAKSLDPRNGSGPAADLADRIDDCWRRGRSGDLKTCVPNPDAPAEAATGNAAFIAALKVLKAYNTTNRPTSINYYIAEKETMKRPAAACNANEHLPSDDESDSLGLVAYHRVPIFVPGNRAFWRESTSTDATWPYRFRGWVGDEFVWGKAQTDVLEPKVCVVGELFPTKLPELYPPGGF